MTEPGYFQELLGSIMNRTFTGERVDVSGLALRWSGWSRDPLTFSKHGMWFVSKAEDDNSLPIYARVVAVAGGHDEESTRREGLSRALAYAALTPRAEWPSGVIDFAMGREDAA